MATFQVEYDDVRNLTLYAMIFDPSGKAYNPTLGLFGIYSDASITSYSCSLTESFVLRKGYYTFSTTGITFPEVFTVEIWQKVGGSPDRSVDYLKGVGSQSFNGVGQTVPNPIPPRLLMGNFVGNPPPSGNMEMVVQFYGPMGVLRSMDPTGLSYTISTNGSGTIVDSGRMAELTNGIYLAQWNVTGSIYTLNEEYVVKVTGYFKQELFQAVASFVPQSYGSTSVGGSSQDILAALAYASGEVGGGVILGLPTASGFNTRMTYNSSNFFNGGFLRFSSGVLYGQTRIIASDTTGYLTFSRPFTSTPTTGMPFLIYSHGGELGVSP